jgi:putative intracellular protease/amidase
MERTLRVGVCRSSTGCEENEMKRAATILICLAFFGCSKEVTVPSRTPVAGSNSSPPKILVIVSSKSELQLREGKVYPTGYYLNEITVPVRKMSDRGYEIVFANPNGNPPKMDKRSDSPDHFGKDPLAYQSYREFHDRLEGLQNPQKLSAVIEKGLEHYSAVFFPGGHAPMVDLIRDKDVGKILNHFHQAGKPTAFICHGPIALISTVKDPEAFVRALEKGDREEALKLASGWPYAGYRMTIFSTAEEQVAEETQLGGKVRFYPDDALIAAGGKVDLAEPWSPNVVKDRELITGQNPGSDGQFAEILIRAIEESESK